MSRIPDRDHPTGIAVAIACFGYAVIVATSLTVVLAAVGSDRVLPWPVALLAGVFAGFGVGALVLVSSLLVRWWRR